jgi:Na+-translocating ferredoxin:NAD+ oxidoreductase RnfC subunit
MDYVQATLRGDFKEIASLSFDCISCGLCAMRCPMEIAPYRVAELARRLYGKYQMPRSRHTEERMKELEEGKYDSELDKLTEMNENELKERYEKRSFEL